MSIDIDRLVEWAESLEAFVREKGDHTRIDFHCDSFIRRIEIYEDRFELRETGNPFRTTTVERIPSLTVSYTDEGIFFHGEGVAQSFIPPRPDAEIELEAY